MKVTLAGSLNGKARILELVPYNNGTIMLTVEYTSRNAGNDGEEAFRESIVVSLSQLKKAVELL